MKLTTKQISDEAQFLFWSRCGGETQKSGPGKKFEKWLNEIEANPPSPEDALIQLYEFYKSAQIISPSFGLEIKLGLFRLLGIPEPKEHSCWFFLCTSKMELYKPSSLNKATQQMEEEIEKVRHPDVKPKMRIA